MSYSRYPFTQGRLAVPKVPSRLGPLRRPATRARNRVVRRQSFLLTSSRGRRCGLRPWCSSLAALDFTSLTRAAASTAISPKQLLEGWPPKLRRCAKNSAHRDPDVILLLPQSTVPLLHSFGHSRCGYVIRLMDPHPVMFSRPHASWSRPHRWRLLPMPEV